MDSELKSYNILRGLLVSGILLIIIRLGVENASLLPPEVCSLILPKERVTLIDHQKVACFVFKYSMLSVSVAYFFGVLPASEKKQYYKAI